MSNFKLEIRKLGVDAKVVVTDYEGSCATCYWFDGLECHEPGPGLTTIPEGFDDPCLAWKPREVRTTSKIPPTREEVPEAL